MSGRLVAWLSVVGVLATISYASRLADGKPPEDALYRYSTAAAGLIQYLLILALILAIARGTDIARTLALRSPATSFGRTLALALGVIVLTYVASFAVQVIGDPGREQGITPEGWQPEHAGAFAANFVVVAVVAPIVEELFFRGLGYTLLAVYGQWAAIVAVGVTFGLVHGLVLGFPVLLTFGAGLAFLRARTRSVYPGIGVHAAFNAIALILSVTT